MQPLHPLDAISPAFERTRQTILTPFKLGRAWKLSACSYLAFAGSIFIPFPLLLLLIPRGILPAGFPVAFLTVAITLQFLLFLALFYCGNRMAFVEFEMIVTRAKVVAPMWKRYGAKTWPYLTLKAVWGTLASIAFAPLCIAKVRTLIQSFPKLDTPATPGGQPDPAVFLALMSHMFGLYALFLLFFFFLKLFDTLLNDFVLPFYAIEEITLGTAISRALQVVRREPGQMLLYLLLKGCLALVGYVALSLVAVVCEIPIGIIGLLIFAIGALVVHLLPAAVGGPVAVIGGVVLYGALYLSFVAVIIGCSGYLFSLLEAYAIYFMGGRYQKLGDYLEPPQYTYAPPPMPPAPDEEDDGDPSLPMNPALA